MAKKQKIEIDRGGEAIKKGKHYDVRNGYKKHINHLKFQTENETIDFALRTKQAVILK